MHDQKVVILMGPQGSGKGTQARIMQDRLAHTFPETQTISIETGGSFRELMSQDGYTSEKIRASVNQGDLQPDWLPSWLFVNSFIKDYQPGSQVVIDGIPRTTGQAKRMDEVFDYYDIGEVSVILLEVTNDISVTRLLGRGRTDDTEAAIEHRLSQYHAETAPVIDYFIEHQRYNLFKIDGGQPVGQVTDDIFTALGI